MQFVHLRCISMHDVNDDNYWNDDYVSILFCVKFYNRMILTLETIQRFKTDIYIHEN